MTPHITVHFYIIASIIFINDLVHDLESLISRSRNSKLFMAQIIFFAILDTELLQKYCETVLNSGNVSNWSVAKRVMLQIPSFQKHPKVL